MKKSAISVVLALTSIVVSAGQSPTNEGDFRLALPAHQGQLQWRADGFKIIQSSAKPNGQEIGIRGKDQTGRFTFLGFLFLVSGETSLTSTKCRDGALEPLKKSNPTFRLLASSEIPSSNELPVELVTYSAQGRDGKPVYSMRGFVATADICGDLEFYGETAINPENTELKSIFQSYRFNPTYVPQFNDVFLYGQILYRNGMYKAAAPILEQSLTKLSDSKSQEMMRRVATDQAGMAYGIAGETAKARRIFESAIAKDPDYPMYYYNLACADAQAKKLADARVHLQQAFARKGNMLQGEVFPDPSKDDSFLPYRNDKDFWEFVESLH